MSFSAVVIFSIVFLAAFATVAESIGLPPKNNLVPLGEFLPKVDDEKGTRQASYYFISQNAASWYTAASDCKANLGDNATLLNIETRQEYEEVNSFIRNSDHTGSTYWTGGRYNVDRATFVWSDGVEINSSAPWDEGYPNTKTPVTRVLAYTAGQLKLRTDFSTVSYRYICELAL